MKTRAGPPRAAAQPPWAAAPQLGGRCTLRKSPPQLAPPPANGGPPSSDPPFRRRRPPTKRNMKLWKTNCTRSTVAVAVPPGPTRSPSGLVDLVMEALSCQTCSRLLVWPQQQQRHRSAAAPLLRAHAGLVARGRRFRGVVSTPRAGSCAAAGDEASHPAPAAAQLDPLPPPSGRFAGGRQVPDGHLAGRETHGLRKVREGETVSPRPICFSPTTPRLLHRPCLRRSHRATGAHPHSQNGPPLPPMRLPRPHPARAPQTGSRRPSGRGTQPRRGSGWLGRQRGSRPAVDPPGGGDGIKNARPQCAPRAAPRLDGGTLCDSRPPQVRAGCRGAAVAPPPPPPNGKRPAATPHCRGHVPNGDTGQRAVGDKPAKCALPIRCFRLVENSFSTTNEAALVPRFPTCRRSSPVFKVSV